MKVNIVYNSIIKIGLLNVLLIISRVVVASVIPDLNNDAMQQTNITDNTVAQQSLEEEGHNHASVLQQHKDINTSSILTHESNQYIKYAKITHDSPLSLLDRLVIKHYVIHDPYIPLVKKFAVRVNYSDLILSFVNSIKGNLFDNSYDFTAGIDLLFKTNMQISGDLGYCYCEPPDKIADNSKKYRSQGIFGGVGMVYLVQYFAYNLYGGIHLNMSIFNNTVPGTATMHKDELATAHWVKLVMGSEKKIKRSNWYLGSGLGVNVLIGADEFMLAENYHIPGYGSKFKYITFDFKLYIKYTLSFVETILRP